MGFILLPVAIGGIAAGVRSTRWIRISQADIDALETSGQSIWKNGVEIIPQMWTDYLANNPNTFPRFLRDDNGFYRTPLGLPVKTRIDEIRSQLPHDPRRGGNIAVADVNVDTPGVPKEYMAHSRINKESNAGAKNPDGSDRGFTYLKEEDQLLLDGYLKDSNGTIPYYDTEAKILEDVAARTSETTTGSNVIYTERAPCASCAAVIESFRKVRPNITLTVIYR